MSSSTGIFAIILSAVLTNNFIFSQFLGCCPFLGCSSKIDTAAGMGLAVTFVMGLASAICWLVNLLLVQLGLQFLQTIAYILVIAALVQFIEMFLKKSMPTLYTALGVYLPLITTNCCVLGVTILAVQDYTKVYEAQGFGMAYAEALICAAGAGVGFLVAMLLFCGVRQRVERSNPPESFKGLPITLVSAAITAMSFMGFGGLVENIIAALM